MKKIFYIISFLLVCMVASAQPGQAVGEIKRVDEILRSYGNYQVPFTVRIGQNGSKGVYYVSGADYRVETEDLIVIGNGDIRYEIHKDLQEVWIDKVDPNDPGVLSYPPAMFRFAENNFDFSYAGKMRTEGVDTKIIRVTPKSKNNSFEHIDIYMSVVDNMPVKAAFSDGKSGQAIEVVFEGYRTNGASEPSLFVFKKENFKNYELIDFRK